MIVLIFLLIQYLPSSELEQQLLNACKQAPNGARIGCVVIDCDSGARLFESHANSPYQLASITKLFVSSAALTELGPQYEFRTSIHRIGAIQNGSIEGLGIIARGDPCLDEHFTEKNPNIVFERWAKAIKSLGITTINGNLIIDVSMFSGPGKPNTYPQDQSNQQQWFSAPASAFAWNDNCIEVRAVPQADGQPCIIECRPSSPSITIINASKSVSSGGNKTFIVSRKVDSNTVSVSGKYNKTTSWFPISIHTDADILAADHFVSILKNAGISLKGHVKIGVFPSNSQTLIYENINFLLPALTILNQRSQNFYGEQIFRILGHHHQGQGSLSAGSSAVLHYLEKNLSIPRDGIDILDGSGLSYENRASAQNICQLLQNMHQHRYGKQFYETLREGPYAWAKNEPSRVKTGSLSVARCLAGYIDGKNTKKRYAFAILLNKGSATSINWASSLREDLYKIMIKHLP